MAAGMVRAEYEHQLSGSLEDRALESEETVSSDDYDDELGNIVRAPLSMPVQRPVSMQRPATESGRACDKAGTGDVDIDSTDDDDEKTDEDSEDDGEDDDVDDNGNAHSEANGLNEPSRKRQKTSDNPGQSHLVTVTRTPSYQQGYPFKPIPPPNMEVPPSRTAQVAPRANAVKGTPQKPLEPSTATADTDNNALPLSAYVRNLQVSYDDLYKIYNNFDYETCDSENNSELAEVLSKSKTLVTPREMDVALNSSGVPVVPFKRGTMIYHCLGKVMDSGNSYGRGMIYPYGFVMSRIYFSTLNPDVKCRYVCRIDCQEGNPMFEVICEDDPQTVYQGLSPTRVWQKVINAINNAKESIVPSSINGPQMFGLTNESVIKYLESKLVEGMHVGVYEIQYHASEYPKPREFGNPQTEEADDPNYTKALREGFDDIAYISSSAVIANLKERVGTMNDTAYQMKRPPKSLFTEASKLDLLIHAIKKRRKHILARNRRKFGSASGGTTVDSPMDSTGAESFGGRRNYYSNRKSLTNPSPGAGPRKASEHTSRLKEILNELTKEFRTKNEEVEAVRTEELRKAHEAMYKAQKAVLECTSVLEATRSRIRGERDREEEELREAAKRKAEDEYEDERMNKETKRLKELQDAMQQRHEREQEKLRQKHDQMLQRKMERQRKLDERDAERLKEKQLKTDKRIQLKEEREEGKKRMQEETRVRRLQHKEDKMKRIEEERAARDAAKERVKEEDRMRQKEKQREDELKVEDLVLVASDSTCEFPVPKRFKWKIPDAVVGDAMNVLEFFNSFYGMFQPPVAVTKADLEHCLTHNDSFALDVYTKCTTALLQRLLDEDAKQKIGQASWFSRLPVNTFSLQDLTRLLLETHAEFVLEYPGTMEALRTQDACDMEAEHKVRVIKYLSDELVASPSFQKYLDDCLESMLGYEKEIRRVGIERNHDEYRRKVAMELGAPDKPEERRVTEKEFDDRLKALQEELMPVKEALRVECLGRDRMLSSYWSVQSLGGVLVERVSDEFLDSYTDQDSFVYTKRVDAIPMDAIPMDANEEEDEGLEGYIQANYEKNVVPSHELKKRMLEHKTQRLPANQWSIYRDQASIAQLIKSLNVLGRRESGLAEKLSKLRNVNVNTLNWGRPPTKSEAGEVHTKVLHKEVVKYILTMRSKLVKQNFIVDDPDFAGLVGEATDHQGLIAPLEQLQEAVAMRDEFTKTVWRRNLNVWKRDLQQVLTYSQLGLHLVSLDSGIKWTDARGKRGRKPKMSIETSPKIGRVARVVEAEKDAVSPSTATAPATPSGPVGDEEDSTLYEVVLAKMRGYPWWPCKLLVPAEGKQKATVLFFAENSVAHVPGVNIKPYTPENLMATGPKPEKRSPKLKIAIEIAANYLAEYGDVSGKQPKSAKQADARGTSRLRARRKRRGSGRRPRDMPDMAEAEAEADGEADGDDDAKGIDDDHDAGDMEVDAHEHHENDENADEEDVEMGGDEEAKSKDGDDGDGYESQSAGSG